MEATLKVIDRIKILELLPKESNIINLKALKKLRSDLNFSEDEIKEFGILSQKKGDVEGLYWDAKKDIGSPIVIGEICENIIKEKLKSLNNENKLTEEFIGLWDKFIGT